VAFPVGGTTPAYTAAATDANPVIYSLSVPNAGLFQINGQTGDIIFQTPPSTAGTNNITVVATDLAGNSSSQAVAITVVNAPTLLPSELDDVANFDPTSNIVLKFNEAVTEVEGKYIRLINEVGMGFRGENNPNTQDILVTDTSQVTINSDGTIIIINPTFDLDLSNSYHIKIDEGAFINAALLGNPELSDPTILNFSTVTPASGLLVTNNLALPAASQSMNDSGLLSGSFGWVDIEGIGNPSSENGTAFDVSNASIAMVFKDYDTTTPTSGSFDGVGAPDFWVSISNFGNDDLFYIDNQANNLPNNLSISSFFADTPSDGTTQLSFGTGTSGLGGLAEITPVGAPSPSFTSALELQTYLDMTYIPIVSA